MKTKTILLVLALILIIIIAASVLFFYKAPKKDSHGCLVSEGYSWCEQNQKCVQNKEDCLEQDLILEILKNMKPVIGMDLNLLDRIVKWNDNNKKEINLDGKGHFYTDLMRSDKILEIFKNVDNFLKQNGFNNDPRNEQKEFSKRYIKENIVANLEIVDNPNDTSTLTIALAYIDKIICDFNTDCGTECNADSDCKVILDGCNKMTVCRNKNYKFFNNCPNPTSIIKEIDFKIQNCQCLENKCAYKKPE